MKDSASIAKQEAEELLKKLGVKTDVEAGAEEEGYSLTVNTDENALLIGKYGNTLSSLEYVLALILAKKSGEYKRVILEVGGYRKEREQYLKDLALRFSEEVKTTGGEKRISNLKSWERRLIHLFLSESTDVVTESTGEGRERVLAIKKK